jgi:hypothetical protein
VAPHAFGLRQSLANRVVRHHPEGFPIRSYMMKLWLDSAEGEKLGHSSCGGRRSRGEGTSESDPERARLPAMPEFA